MKVIAISNQKGGVAKTTTTLSLGACLAEMGKSVLLVDLDPQGHLTISMGLSPDKLRRSISDVLLANASLVSASKESPVFGLDIVPANQQLALIDKLLYGQRNYEFRLQKRLNRMDQNLYDIVLLDCPPYFGTLTLNALTAAESLIIPAQCEFYASHSLRQIIELVKLVRNKTNAGLSYHVLITMFDRRNRINRVILEQMNEEMNGVLYQTLIEVDTKLRESPVFGQPITLYAPNTRGAKQYRELAEEVLSSEQK